MRSFAERLAAAQPARSRRATVPAQPHSERTPQLNPVLHLQRTIGNQAMQLLLQRKPAATDTALSPPTSPRFGHELAQMSLPAPAAVARQDKLPVNTPGDEYEQEAEQVAAHVMRMPEPRLERASLSGGSAPAYQSEQPARQPASDARHLTAPPIVNKVLGASGRPLDAAVRAFMEPRFGRDFAQVRLHTDARAAESSRSVGAAAYTVGEDIVFGAGQYQPETPAGRALLAHELAHVRQQSSSKPILQRAPIPGWNFTPTDFSNLRTAGKDLTIAQDSSWFPAKLQDNLLNTLRLLLGPTISPKPTEGVNVLDFFHGHVVVNRKDLLVTWEGKERPPEQVMKHAEDFEKQEKSAAARTLGGTVTNTSAGRYLTFRGRYPLTTRNLPAFTTAIESLLPAFGNVLEEAVKVPGAAVMYHTFELITPSDLAAAGQKLAPENPRRHYVTPLDTNTPTQYTPPPGGYEKEYLVVAPFSFLVDTNGAVHVRPFAASAGSLFTSLELSTVTGTPFSGEPFPIP